MDDDIKYMERCLFLAEKGRAYVKPNPMVGAVIVANNKIIGEGYHTEYGMPHAEVEAINSVSDHWQLKNSTLYVSLEPCCHHGKTSPCTSLLIEKQIPKVVIAMLDPSPLISRKGVSVLKKNNINVITGICEKEAKELNIRFVTFHTRKRPYIILKWAQTKDNFIDIINRKTFSQINWISNDYTKAIVHKWRTEEAAIIIGTNTALNDNPELTAREWPGNNPLRVIIDRGLNIPENSKIFNKESNTLVFHDNKIIPPSIVGNHIEFFALEFEKDIIPQILSCLHSKSIISLIVEGGQKLLQSFIDLSLWDEARVIVGDKFFKQGIHAPVINSSPVKSETFINDIIYFYKNFMQIYL